MSYDYPRGRRITRSSEFRSVLAKGSRVRTLDLDVRMLDSPFKYIRVGIIVPRYGHKAVARNLVKRRLRELTRTLLLPIRASKNVVVRCKPSVYDCSFEDLVQQMSSVLAALMGGDSAKSEQ